MISLNLSEFKDYQFKEVYTFIMQDQTDFEIIIERVKQTGPDHGFIILGIHIAAYVGEKLNEIAFNFEYNVPAPHIKECILNSPLK